MQQDNKPKLIAVAGSKGAGKDTIGNFFVLNGYIRKSFADPLKDCVAAIFDWDRSMLQGDTVASRKWREEPDLWWEVNLNWKNKNNPYYEFHPRFTPRVALQLMGTNIIRDNFNNNFWILRFRKELKKLQKENIVLTDVRFINELDEIKNNNGIIIRVKRGPDPEWFELAKQVNKGTASLLEISEFNKIGIHPSETNWIGYDYDYVIENDGSLSELTEQLQDLFKNIK